VQNGDASPTLRLNLRSPSGRQALNRCTFGSRGKFLAIEDEFEDEDEDDFLGFWRRNLAKNENKITVIIHITAKQTQNTPG